MDLEKLKNKIPNNVFSFLKKKNFSDLRPSQVKSIKKGLFEGKNLVVCTPTASGKTLVAELAFLNIILNKSLKAVYIVPLRALASEKYFSFKKNYPDIKIGLSTGELDSSSESLKNFDLLILTSEKFDSVLRHKASWIKKVGLVIVDEIHLLNDASRGPTLEIVIAILKKEVQAAQLIGLSATIGNPEELAKWLDAEPIIDGWRPTKLKKGVYLEGELYFKE